jgi:hypothetical protein
METKKFEFILERSTGYAYPYDDVSTEAGVDPLGI